MASLALRRSNWISEILNIARNDLTSSSRSQHCRHSAGKTRSNHFRTAAPVRPFINSAISLQAQTTPASQSPPPSSSPTPAKAASTPANTQPIQNISKTGLSDRPFEIDLENNKEHVDWTRSFHGLSTEPFPKEAAAVLLEPPSEEDVEIKPDGIVYLPEIKYRRILNRAFGPGGWGLAPRGESIVTAKSVTREYALVAHGRLVSIARGEQDYFSPEGIPTATEGCKSNAMIRCCKDLGVASELWDPRWIRKFKAAHTREVFVEHIVNKRKTKIWIRKDAEVSYPWKVTK